jgi:hypothetical protein
VVTGHLARRSRTLRCWCDARPHVRRLVERAQHLAAERPAVAVAWSGPRTRLELVRGCPQRCLRPCQYVRWRPLATCTRSAGVRNNAVLAGVRTSLPVGAATVYYYQLASGPLGPDRVRPASGTMSSAVLVVAGGSPRRGEEADDDAGVARMTPGDRRRRIRTRHQSRARWSRDLQ